MEKGSLIGNDKITNKSVFKRNHYLSYEDLITLLMM